MPNKYGFSGEVPPNVSLENNIRLALEYKQTHPSIYDRIIWFNEMVRNNKDRHLPLNNSFDYKQIHPKYAQFGNFNYGVVGTALGLSASVLKWGAGDAASVFSRHRFNRHSFN